MSWRKSIMPWNTSISLQTGQNCFLPGNALYLTSFYVPGRSTPVKGKQGRKETEFVICPGEETRHLKESLPMHLPLPRSVPYRRYFQI